MLAFWIVVVVLIVVTLGLILPSLFKPSTATVVERDDEKRAIFRQQFEEIAQDKRNGALDATQYEIAKSELERRMLDEISTDLVRHTTSKPDRTLALTLAVLLPIASILIYLKIGNPAAVSVPLGVPNSATDVITASQHQAMGGGIEPLLNSLKSKLEQHPDDGEGWALLARSYVELRRHSEALLAYEKATLIIKNDPQLYADYADALGVVNGHNLLGKPEELVNKALALDANHPKALMLAGTVAFDRKDYKQAITLWERLQRVLPVDSEMLAEVKTAINESYAVIGEKPPETTKKESLTIGTQAASVTGTVKIAKHLANKISPSDTLFIFARIPNGSPMPLAIVRTTASELPYQFKLDDTKALMPNNKLSQANEVIIVARISKTGDAKSQTGDLQGISTIVKPNVSNVDLEINELIR